MGHTFSSTPDLLYRGPGEAALKNTKTIPKNFCALFQ